MLHRGASFLCLCIVAMQLLQVAVGVPPFVDPEVKARLEAKVIQSMSLKDIEAMVENDERVQNAPKSRIIIIPKKKNADGLLGEDDREAIVIHRKPKKPHKRADNLEYRFADIALDRGTRRSSFVPAFAFESQFRSHHEDDFPSLFSISDLESAGSSSASKFYESLVDSVMNNKGFGVERDPFALLDMAASEDVPQYKPRFDYDAYSKDSTETKLQGKPYWRDAPERRDELIDENGCRTVIKKVVDPEDEKKSGSEKAKSVVITKECEYPNLNGPDAKIPEAPPLRHGTSRFDEPASDYDNEPISYEKTRPVELNFKQSEARDPLATDYIDTMLDKHFKSFPGFSNPLSSFKGYQERFKLRMPEALKDIKPTVGVQTYEYSHPKSGFDEERQSAPAKEPVHRDAPRTYDHHYHYDYPPQDSRKPDNSQYDDDRESKPVAKSADPKDPKMVKKSFAYYRKDNPKDDPNDHQYAEEYAQGNFRSFSSSYDSEKDGPKKQQ